MEKEFEIEDKYENILRLGGQCPEETYLARMTGSRKLVVRKNVSSEGGLIYAQLLHIKDPHLPYIYEINPSREGTEIILDYISGDSLEEIVSGTNGLKEWKAVDYFRQLLQILAIIHRDGIVHRDINANNIVISTDGILKLLDFGIARRPKESQSQDTTILGTVGYAAPEQFGFQQTDQRTDLYAAGVLLNYMLTGHLPTEQRAIPEYDRIIGTCTRIDPNLRYQNTQQLQVDFEKVVAKRVCAIGQNTGQNIYAGTEQNIYAGTEQNIYAGAERRTQEQESEKTWLPGFRTGKLWKKIIAVAGYVFMIIGTGVYIAEGKTLVGKVLELTASLLFFWIPVACGTNVFHWDQKIWPVSRFSDGAKGGVRAILSILIFILGAYLFGIINPTT